MSRAQKQRRRGSLKPSAQRQPTAIVQSGNTTKRTGRERPDASTQTPIVPDDATARVIKTRS